ncbi:MAG: N-acetyltransferase [Candidatus Thorarchaeota archaeon]|nr:N-acetyltransferase [Candidatus Thorarchaeota archaeon]
MTSAKQNIIKVCPFSKTFGWAQYRSPEARNLYGVNNGLYNGKLVCLRALESADFEEIYRFWNTWELRRTIGVPLPKSRSSLLERFNESMVSDPWETGSMTLAIVERRTGTFLGLAALSNMKCPHYRARLSISILDPTFRSRGFGTDATRVLLWVGFHLMALNSVTLDTFPDNIAAIRAYEKAGFKKVGLIRKTEFMGGNFHDLLLMDILREEFLQQYPPGSYVCSE